MIETRKTKLTATKGGSGSSTFRATLPTAWIRKMGLNENKRDLKLEFDGEKIVIKNNEGEIKMLNNLLERAKVEIEKEMDEMGFVDDSDNSDRFLDDLARGLVEKELVPDEDNIDLYYEKEGEIEGLSEELLEGIIDYMEDKYSVKGKTDKSNNYTGCYYKDKEGLEKWEATI